MQCSLLILLSQLAIEHEIDRYQDFFTIVMGEFVYSLFDGQPTGPGFHVAAGKAIMALMIAFCFQLFYMNGGWSKTITHPLRYSVHRAMVFFTCHLPIVSALTLCGDALADFVKETRVSSGVRWMACASYAVGMIMLWALAIVEHERDAKGELWFPKVRIPDSVRSTFTDLVCIQSGFASSRVYARASSPSSSLSRIKQLLNTKLKVVRLAK